jgi:hypothetical protein
VLIGFWWGSLREKRPLGKGRRKWEGNIKMYLQLLEWGQVADSCEVGNEPRVQ